MECGEEIGHVAMPATGGPEYIGEDDEGAFALADVVDGDAVDRQLLPLGLVVGGKLLPGGFWTTAHIFRIYLRSMGDYTRVKYQFKENAGQPLLWNMGD